MMDAACSDNSDSWDTFHGVDTEKRVINLPHENSSVNFVPSWDGKRETFEELGASR